MRVVFVVALELAVTGSSSTAAVVVAIATAACCWPVCRVV
jgi:hypothetical protein